MKKRLCVVQGHQRLLPDWRPRHHRVDGDAVRLHPIASGLDDRSWREISARPAVDHLQPQAGMGVTHQALGFGQRLGEDGVDHDPVSAHGYLDSGARQLDLG
jgi:hypothetical protein